MSTYALLTAVGPDRSGLVNRISKCIADCKCNIEDSRMAILGNQFAMLILVQGQPDAIQAVLDQIPGVGEEIGLTVTARETQAAGASKQDVIPYDMAVYSMDQPGIVQEISAYLAEQKINVRALDTRVTHAPITGLPLFSLHATIDVPSSQKIGDVRRGLEAIGAEENLDIELKPFGA